MFATRINSKNKCLYLGLLRFGRKLRGRGFASFCFICFDKILLLPSKNSTKIRKKKLILKVAIRIRKPRKRLGTVAKPQPDQRRASNSQPIIRFEYRNRSKKFIQQVKVNDRDSQRQRNEEELISGVKRGNRPSIPVDGSSSIPGEKIKTIDTCCQEEHGVE